MRLVRRNRTTWGKRLIGASVCSVVSLALVPAVAQASVEPASVEVALSPGEAHTVTKTVGVPEVPPKLDLVLDVDLSGSYGDDIANIKAKSSKIFDGVRAQVSDSTFGLTTFVDYPFFPWGAGGGCGDYAYQRDQDLTADKATWIASVNAMALHCGGDGPESQYESLFQAATGAGRDVAPAGPTTGDVAPGLGATFRADATKVIVITTDAPFHVAGDSNCSDPGPCPFPYPGPTAAETISALQAANIKVIALKAPGSGAEMNKLATETGGAVVNTGADSSQIVEAIVGALDELTFEITGTPVGCDPLDVTFDPASHSDVAGGSTVNFDETITVPAGSPGGTVDCTVEFKADDTVIGVQHVRVTINTPPDCSTVAPDITSLWPPNRKMHLITLDGATDPDGDPVDLVVTGVTQDEAVNGLGDGDTGPDAQLGPESNEVSLRAERSGTGNGRVYRIAFTGTDPAGASCSGTVTVGVPHDKRGASAVDSGDSFDSLTS